MWSDMAWSTGRWWLAQLSQLALGGCGVGRFVGVVSLILQVMVAMN